MTYLSRLFIDYNPITTIEKDAFNQTSYLRFLHISIERLKTPDILNIRNSIYQGKIRNINGVVFVKHLYVITERKDDCNLTIYFLANFMILNFIDDHQFYLHFFSCADRYSLTEIKNSKKLN